MNATDLRRCGEEGQPLLLKLKPLAFPLCYAALQVTPALSPAELCQSRDG